MTTTTNDDRLTAVHELHELLLATDDFAGFLQQLADLATRTGSSRTSCGVTVRMDEHPLTVASSDDLATRVDEVQYASGVGPCLQSMDTGEVIDVPRLRRRGSVARVPDGGDRERAAVLAVNPHPRRKSTRRRDQPLLQAPGSFSEQDRRSATMFAAQASGCLAVANRMARHVELTTHLQAALASRSVIDQAIGIVMAQNKCHSDAAFDVSSPGVPAPQRQAPARRGGHRHRGRRTPGDRWSAGHLMGRSDLEATPAPPADWIRQAVVYGVVPQAWGGAGRRGAAAAGLPPGARRHRAVAVAPGRDTALGPDVRHHRLPCPGQDLGQAGDPETSHHRRPEPGDACPRRLRAQPHLAVAPVVRPGAAAGTGRPDLGLLRPRRDRPGHALLPLHAPAEPQPRQLDGPRCRCSRRCCTG